MKIIVCGGRTFFDKELCFHTLDYLNSKRTISIVVHGGAKGADSLAGVWAKQNNLQCIVYEADWDACGKGAGFIRNKTMIESNLDAQFLVAFPGGSGTNMAIDIATKNNMKVIKI